MSGERIDYRPRAQRAISIIWAVASLACLVASMSDLQIDRSGGSGAAAGNLANLRPFWLAQASLWAALTALWMGVARRGAAAGAECQRGRAALVVTAFIIALGLLARVTVLALHEPALSDDVYRYVFDGRNLASGTNPYLVRPAEGLADGVELWAGEERLLARMGHLDFTTPYLPTSQYVFGVLGAIIGNAEWMRGSEASARLFRIAFVLVELGLIVTLARAPRAAGRSPWYLALYAWHPLPLTEIAGSGHQDILGIALIAAALLTSSANPRRVCRWAVLVAIAALVKPVAALAGLMLLRGQPASDWLKAAALGGIVAAALVAPLWVLPQAGGEAFANWRGTAVEMADRWAHFGGVYEPVLFVVRKAMPDAPARGPGFNLVQERLARGICLAMLVIALAMIFVSRGDRWQRTSAALLALALLTTTAHPWYLLWALALAPLAMSWTLWVYSLTISWGYMVLVSGKGMWAGEEWTVTPWVIAAAYGPVLGALAVDLALHFRPRRDAGAKPRAAEGSSDC